MNTNEIMNKERSGNKLQRFQVLYCRKLGKIPNISNRIIFDELIHILL